MLMIVGLVSCISSVIPAPVNVTKNASYILATVLFYKDASGRIMLANGPIPEVAAMAINADVSSRFKEAAVKVVPAFDQPESLLNSSNIIETFKNKTVFAIEVKKRLSRNAIVNWWNNLFHKNNKPKPKLKKRSTEIKEFMDTTQDLNSTTTTSLKPTVASTPSEESPVPVTTTSPKPTEACSSSEESPVPVSTTSPKPTEACSSSEESPVTSISTTSLKPTEASKSSEESPDIMTHQPKLKTKITRLTTKSDGFSEEEDRLNEFFQDNKQSDEKSNPKRLRYFDQFVPNDIYYGVEKKCVNWSDGCDHHAGLLSNMSSLHLVYIKPRFAALPIE